MRIKRRLFASTAVVALVSTLVTGVAFADDVGDTAQSGTTVDHGTVADEPGREEMQAKTELAAVQPSREIRPQDLCATSQDGLITRSGAKVTINLDRANAKKLMIGSSKYGDENCLESLQVLTFTNSANSNTRELFIGWRALDEAPWTAITFPSNMDLVELGNNAFEQSHKVNLETVTFGSNVQRTVIGSSAFRQSADRGLSNRLATVTFGKNSKEIEIGFRSFTQSVQGGGDNALKTLTFSPGVQNLLIEVRAFEMVAEDGGRTPLATVYFPDGVKNLDVGYSAFQQLSTGDVSASRTELKEVSIPGGMDTLKLESWAFTRGKYSGSTGFTQPRLTFRTAKAPTSGPNTIVLGTDITQGDQYWYWDGADDVMVAKAWERQIKSISTAEGKPYMLRGQATIKPGSVRITGTAQVGSTLTADPGTWTPAGVKLDYQWLLDGKAISGATGKTYKPVSAQVGKNISVRVTGSFAGSKPVATTSGSVKVNAAPKPAPKPDRLAGVNRYETNYQVNLKDMKPGKPLFVATGAQFPDALSIGPAVALTDGALLLAPPKGFQSGDKSLQLVKQRKPSAVYVIGGDSAVSNSVANQVGTAAGRSPERIGGKNRYETSDRIFSKFFSNRSLSAAFIATGSDYPDALSASSAGGTLGMPVLLVPGKSANGALQTASLNLLRSKGVRSLVMVGGPSVITNQVSGNLQRQGNFTVTRRAGNNRYATNMSVNDFVNSQKGGTTSITGIWIATGANFPDALSAGGPAGKAGQRLVLSNGTCIPKPVVSSWIKGPNSNVKSIELVGGTSVLKPSVASLTQCK